MSELRSKDKLWLVDELATDAFPRNLLPITGEVLRVLEWHIRRNPRDLGKAIQETTLRIQEQWQKANVPTIDRCHIIKKVRQLHNQYAVLKKSKSRECGKAVEDRMSFQIKLKKLFDIAHRDAMQLMTIEDDRQFLNLQRGFRREGKMLGVDKAWIGKEERKIKRKMTEENKLKREKDACQDRIATVWYESTSSSSSSPDQSPCKSRAKKSSRGTKTVVITSEVAAALDRGAMSVLVPFASALGSNVDELSISASTIHRHRRKRKEKAAEIKESFSTTVPLTVHWDGKLMPGLTNGKVVDRLPILVSGEGVLKLLAVPVTDGKAEPTSNTIMEVINEWNLQDRIAALCFDTTATNSGLKGGVCMRLQQILGRDLLHLACRHHILELLLEAVFSALVPEVSRSPDITIFQQFKDFWPSVVTTAYRTTEDVIRSQPWATDIFNFCQAQLHLNHPRDDYRELLELVVIFLGGVPHGRQSIIFRKPGAVHRARWMARAIYGLKMWIFLPQFSQHRLQRSSTSRVGRSGDLDKLTDFCIFLVKHYVRAWFSARSATSAPRHDITILKALGEEDNTIIRKAGTRTLTRHLWYLSEVNVGMALFDEELSLREKESFIANMNAVDGSKELSPRLKTIPDGLKDMTVASFATKNTKRFFELLHIDTSFFDEDPANWKDSPSYQAGLKRVEGLVVTNDVAERGVALVQEFTRSGRTKAEDQLQFLLQVVEDHRREIPHLTKSQLIKKLNTNCAT